MTPRRIALTFVALVALAPVAGAQAARQGTATIELRGEAVKSLRGQDVKIQARGAARATRARIRLPVAGGLVSSIALLNHDGGLRLRRRAGGAVRTLRLTRLQTRLGKRSKIVGRVGRRRLTVFTVKATRARPSLDATSGSASLHGARVTLTRKAGQALKRKLRLRRLPRGAFGTLDVDAVVRQSGGGNERGGSGGGGGGGGGTGGGGPPTSGPVGDEPPMLARPPGAVDITSAQMTWRVRPSFIRYVNAAEGTTPFGGATPDAVDSTPECGEASEPPEPLVYAFHFPFAHGWYDPPTDVAGVFFSGGVNFRYSSHGIDLDVKEPEIELAGASSRAIFRFDGRRSTAVANKRAVLVNLDTAAAPPAETPTTVTYDRIPGTIPVGGSQSVFAGFYQPGDRFGCISVSFTHAGGP